MSMTTQPDYVMTSDDLATITSDVWAAFLLVDGDQPLLPARTPISEDCEIVHASVGVQGAWVGQIVLEVTGETAERVARAMLVTEHVSDGDVTDAVGELVNMVGGNVKSLMPSPSTLGLPIVLRGRVSGYSAYDASEVCTVDLEWTHEPIRVGVWAARTNEN